MFIEMLSLDNRTFILLGGAAAAITASAYVLWGPSERKPNHRKRDTCPGLVNVGNSCFLNSVLQALAPCCSIQQWLTEFTAKCYHKSSNQFLAHTLVNVLQVLNNASIEHTEEYCPSDVLDALRARRWVISADEQDAHELFHVLTETLDEESSRYPNVVSLFDVASIQDGVQFQADTTACTRSSSRLPVLPTKESEHPFRGLLASQLQCKSCGYKCPVKYDTFDSLSLSIPANHMGPLTIEQLLKHYIMCETVQNVECEGCSKKQQQQLPVSDGSDVNANSSPKPKATFLKKLTIGKLPQCLCIHVQRTVWLNSGLPMKRFDHISFPEVLHMDRYVYQTKHQAQPVRDLSSGLVGGRNVNGYNRVNRHKLQTSPSTVTAPYSQPVNLLKALNYHSRATMSGLRLQPVQSNNPTTRVQSRQPSPSISSEVVRQLARRYMLEAACGAISNNSYKLAAVVVHLGDVFSGHFVTYRRVPSKDGQHFPDKWLYTSDSSVRKASLAEVLQAPAYMLFYEKI